MVLRSDYTAVRKRKDTGRCRCKAVLAILKPLHAGWVVDLYNYMTSADGKKVIENEWVASGIADAVIKKG